MHFHIKLKKNKQKLKKNSVTLQAYSNTTYLRNQLQNLKLTLQNLHSPPLSPGWGKDLQKTLPGKTSYLPLLGGMMTRKWG